MTFIRRIWDWCAAHRAAAALIASFAAVALTFTAATMIAQLSSLEIRGAAQEITGNSSPSITQLSALRSCLRKLELRADDHLDTCEGNACQGFPEIVTALVADAQARWESYKRLPVFPNEPAHWPGIDAAFVTLESEMGQVERRLVLGDLTLASRVFHGSVEPAFDRLDELVDQLIADEHAEGVARATRIDGLARRSLVLAIALDLVSIALTVMTAGLAVRLVRREERLLQDRAEELDRFAGQVSHEILNPLCAVDASLGVANRAGDPASRAALARIEESVAFIRHLVCGLLDFARSSSPRRAGASSDVGQVIDDVVEQLRPLADQERVELVLDGAFTESVGCSGCVLATIVSNLVTNGIKFLGAAARRTVVIRPGRCLSGRVRIEVVDTGPGIDPSVRERVFDPFVRGCATTASGFGLGLTTVKRLVSAHGGSVGFAPDACGGTCFWVELPASRGLELPALPRLEEPLPVETAPGRVGVMDPQL